MNLKCFLRFKQRTASSHVSWMRGAALDSVMLAELSAVMVYLIRKPEVPCHLPASRDKTSYEDI